jgi:RND superfamily putative drug exporter
MAVGLVALDANGLTNKQSFRHATDSVTGETIASKHFAGGAGSPVVAVGDARVAGDLATALGRVPGIASVDPPVTRNGVAFVEATMTAPPDSAAGYATIDRARAALHPIGPSVKVGGNTAIQLDTRDTVDSDRRKVIPAILVVIFIVLSLLLRALMAPLLLLLANVLSFGATMGVSALLFNHVFDFPASDPSTSLIGFVFLVALGIDYSIFLMTRVREESLRQGTHPGVLKGLSVTGGVITSAGVVLAATFAALGVVPILFLAQIAFIVAFGVLLDTLVVRSLLVPALSYQLGPRIWWPSRLWHTPDHADRATADMLHVGREDGVRVDT